MFNFLKNKKKQKLATEKRIQDAKITLAFLNALHIETGKAIINNKRAITLPYNYIKNNYNFLTFDIPYHCVNIVLYSEENQIIFAGTNPFEFYNFFKTIYPEKALNVINNIFISALSSKQGCNSMVEWQSPKLLMRVRFLPPLPIQEYRLVYQDNGLQNHRRKLESFYSCQ